MKYAVGFAVVAVTRKLGCPLRRGEAPARICTRHRRDRHANAVAPSAIDSRRRRSLLAQRTFATCLPTARRQHTDERRRLRRAAAATDAGGDNPQSIGDQLNERFNALLDSPVFDPDDTGNANEPEWLRNWRDLWQRDQQMAETLFVGFYFALLLFFAQQGVRIYKHCYFMPDNTCPWDVGPVGIDPLNF